MGKEARLGFGGQRAEVDGAVVQVVRGELAPELAYAAEAEQLDVRESPHPEDTLLHGRAAGGGAPRLQR